jgi:hypothetical protein
MTPEQQRIAIAEACGWRIKRRDITGFNVWEPDAKLPAQLCNNLENKIPNYLYDLNAMHEAEKMLDDEQDLDYSESLELVIGARWSANNSCDMQRFRSATAAQRAEAFLKTLNLWKP